MVSKSESSRKKKQTPYTKGQLNYIIDDLIHPFFAKYEAMRLLDCVLHAIVERNPKLSVKKTIQYNLPVFTRKALKKRKSKKEVVR